MARRLTLPRNSGTAPLYRNYRAYSKRLSTSSGVRHHFVRGGAEPGGARGQKVSTEQKPTLLDVGCGGMMDEKEGNLIQVTFLGDRGSRHHDAPQCRTASKSGRTPVGILRPGYASARSRILLMTISMS